MSDTLASELLHFSLEPLDIIRDTLQATTPRVKPNGFWVSVGPEWAEWCVAEQFYLANLSHVSRVLLSPDANVLRLTGAWDLDVFTDEYGSTNPEYLYARRGESIDWARVAAKHDGIVIAPYVYERRFEFPWYYGWGVASGCIWNARAIASLTSIRLVPEELERAS